MIEQANVLSVMDGSVAESKEPAALTDIGCERETNEDRCLIEDTPNGLLCIVCDGMGGAMGGEIAAQLALDAVQRKVRESVAENRLERLKEAVLTANTDIVNYRTKPGYHGMGSSIVTALIAEDGVSIVHSGDCRAYLVQDGEIHQLTLDHTHVQELVDQGKLTKEEALCHPDAHILARCLGPMPELEVEMQLYPFTDTSNASGDALLLVSDGLFRLVAEDEMKRLVDTCDPAEACRELIARARARGGYDNITAAVIPLKGRIEPGQESAIVRFGASVAPEHTAPEQLHTDQDSAATPLFSEGDDSDLTALTLGSESSESAVHSKRPLLIVAACAMILISVGLIFASRNHAPDQTPTTASVSQTESGAAMESAQVAEPAEQQLAMNNEGTAKTATENSGDTQTEPVKVAEETPPASSAEITNQAAVTGQVVSAALPTNGSAQPSPSAAAPDVAGHAPSTDATQTAQVPSAQTQASTLATTPAAPAAVVDNNAQPAAPAGSSETDSVATAQPGVTAQPGITVQPGVTAQPGATTPDTGSSPSTAPKLSYEEALKAQSKQYFDIGVQNFQAGKLEEAISSFRTAITLDSKNADAQYNLGIVYVKQGKNDDAIRSFSAAIRLNPKYAEAYYNLAYVYYQAKQYQQALALFKQFHEIAQEEARFQSKLAGVEQTIDRLEDYLNQDAKH